MMKIMDGNEACSYVSYLFSEMAGIYPITPASTMAEKVDEWSNKGKTKSVSHREHLSQALKKYWDSVPSRSKDLSMQEYLQGENNSSVKPSNQNAE